jgi:hypothetical protein
MHNIDDIYVEFRKSQAKFHNRPYRIPKDMEKTYAKMSPKNFASLKKITEMFSTCYHNINPEVYFDCGFQLYKNRFSYAKFFDTKIMKIYIIKDKNTKREVEISKKAIIDSLKYIINWIGIARNKRIPLLAQYCSMYDTGQLAPIKHYNMYKIDKYFLVWLMRDGYFRLEDNMKVDIPIIVDNYRNLSYDVAVIDKFLYEVKDKIKEM